MHKRLLLTWLVKVKIMNILLLPVVLFFARNPAPSGGVNLVRENLRFVLFVMFGSPLLATVAVSVFSFILIKLEKQNED